MVEENAKSLRFFKGIDIAILVPFLTVLSYGMAYLQNKGFYSFYKVPPFLITLNLISLSQMVFDMLPYFLGALGYFLGVYRGKRIYRAEISESQKKTYRNYEYILVFILLAMLVESYFRLGLIGVFIKLIQMVIPYFILVLLVLYQKKRYEIVSLILISFLFLPYLVGYFNAAIKQDYYVVHIESENHVVINSFNEKLILAPVNLKNNTFKAEFTIHKLESDKKNKLKMIYTKTGMLKMTEKNR
jgi:hypothetical protein